MTFHFWLLFALAHLLGAIVWLGGGPMLCALGFRVRRAADAASIGEFNRTVSHVGPRVLTPGVVATVLFGIWMTLERPEWAFGQAWILIGLGLFAVAFLVGAIYLSRIGIEMQRVDEGPADAANSRRLLDR